MSDMMTFPDTVEEFMENYKIVDTDEVYTNGAELVPIFRMKQWFEHLPSAQPERKKGEWISNDIDPEAWNFCSVCGEQAIDLFDFCPNCGADMRGEQDG